MDHLADPPIPATADLAIEVTAEPADEPPPPRFGTATATMLGVVETGAASIIDAGIARAAASSSSQHALEATAPVQVGVVVTEPELNVPVDEEALRQAAAEGLTLQRSAGKAGFKGVTINRGSKTKPFQVQLWRNNKKLTLGYFATAEAAALCYARSPEGKKEGPPPRVALTAEAALQAAAAEGLTLVPSDNKAGYQGVKLSNTAKTKAYEAQVRRAGKKVYLGHFATAEEAALIFARTPEGREAAAAYMAATPSLSVEEAIRQAEAEGLTLHKAESKTGYKGVYINDKRARPYKAKMMRDGKLVSLGAYASAEEAALVYARSTSAHAAYAHHSGGGMAGSSSGGGMGFVGGVGGGGGPVALLPNAAAVVAQLDVDGQPTYVDDPSMFPKPPKKRPRGMTHEEQLLLHQQQQYAAAAAAHAAAAATACDGQAVQYYTAAQMMPGLPQHSEQYGVPYEEVVEEEVYDDAGAGAAAAGQPMMMMQPDGAYTQVFTINLP